MTKKVSKNVGKTLAPKKRAKLVSKSRSASKKCAAKAAKKKVSKKVPAGYQKTESGVLAPANSINPIPASKLRSGFKKAKKEINEMVEEIASTMTENYVISEIELEASFSADGKFMGFGVGGAATIKIKIKPESE